MSEEGGKKVSSLVKKGFYINEEQMEQLATLVYNSRKDQKRFINESMVVRIALELLFKTPLDFTQFTTEQEIREYLQNAVVSLK